MNIVYLHTHDLGRCVEPYGYAFRAPTMQRFAEQSVLFRHAFCTAPSCSPSRAGLLTGQYPHQCGMNGLASPYHGHRIDDFGKHLAAYLRRQGYETALSGVHHVGTMPWVNPAEALPYDHFLAQQSPLLTPVFADIAPNAAEFIRGPHDKPFFLACGFNTTHHSQWHRIERETQDSMGPIDSRYTRPLPMHPDTELTRHETAKFERAIRRVDEEFRIVLDAVDDSGQRDNTLVIMTTDHGIGLPGIKCYLNDQGTGVMLMIRGPRGFEGGRVVDATASHLDLYPTICDVLGTQPPDWLEGKSLLPLVDGSLDGELHDAIFTELGYHGFPKWQRAVRTTMHKYIRYFGPDTTLSTLDTDGGDIARYMNARGRKDMPVPREQLYDLVQDPGEANNLADDPAMANVKADLRDRLDAWQQRTNDPLQVGELPPEPAQADPGYVDRLHDMLEAGGWTFDLDRARKNCRDSVINTLAPIEKD